MKRVFVSGYGIVSSIGIGVAQNLASLKGANPGIALPKYLPTEHPDFMLGEVKATTGALLQKSGFAAQEVHSRTIALGALAAKEAVEMANCNAEDLSESYFINATSVAGMDRTEKAYKNVLSGTAVDSAVYLHHECNDSTQVIANHLGAMGGRFTISTACSSSANAIMQGARLIKNGHAEMVIVGGTDALSLFTLNGFRSLQILDKNWCRPFDQTRTGLNLGEGAAYLVIESEASLKRRNATALAEVAGYGNTNDAFHQTASSPEGNGATTAMQTALDVANLAPEAIGYINAHGTGTDINDSSEGNAMTRIFGDNIPPFSSTKSFTGHTLAAAGSIEGVFSMLALREQCVFPNLNCEQPIAELPAPIKAIESIEINHVLSNSFGFGGNCSAVIFSKT